MELLRSKKFLVSLIAVLSAALGHFGFDIPKESLEVCLMPFLVYIVSQGVADHGKERSRVEGDKKLELAQELTKNETQKPL